MRARYLKPEFFTDKKIAALGIAAGMTFEALWCVADDGGVAQCDAVQLKGQLLMRWDELTVEVIETSLDKLTAAGRVQHYTLGDRDYYLIHSWKRNQPVHNPGQFRHPRPPQHVTRSGAEGLPQDGGSDEAGGSPSSHPIHLESSTPQHLDTSTPDGDVQRRSSDALLEIFEEAWAAYPKRAGGDSKHDALLAFQARVKSGEDPAQMLAGTLRYNAYCVATDKTGTEYVKQARTFFGRARHYLETWELPAAQRSAKRSGPREYDYSHPSQGPVKWAK